MPQPLIQLGGQSDSPIMHIAVANGFPPQTYHPLVRPFAEAYRIVSLPPRALWGDQSPPTNYQDWEMLADDMLAGFDSYDLQDIIAVGHSFGGIASILAVLKEPERFKALILLDPTILMPNILDMIRQMWEQDVVDNLPMVQMAKRRRRVFDNREDAFERFRGKSLFDGWSDEVLRLYIEHGTQPQADGNGIELAWSAEWEAYYFATMRLSIWEDLRELDGIVPTLFLRGGISDTFVATAEEDVKKLVPSAEYSIIEGHGHLFPQSAPQTTSTVIADWLNRQQAR